MGNMCVTRKQGEWTSIYNKKTGEWIADVSATKRKNSSQLVLAFKLNEENTVDRGNIKKFSNTEDFEVNEGSK